MNEAMDALTHKSADHDLILRNFRGVVEGLEGRFATITVRSLVDDSHDRDLSHKLHTRHRRHSWMG
jgi:hypothetical protein